MKKIILSILVFTSVVSYAQQINIDWGVSWGGSGNELAQSAVTDSMGNVYIAGSFLDTVDFDPGVGVTNLISASNNNSDISIHKLDSSGNLIWAKSIGGIGSDYGREITLDVSGNIYVTGEFEDTVDFDPGVGVFNLTCNSARDIYILKLSASGTFIWAKSIEGIHTKYANSIAVDDLGNVYTTGTFVQNADFNPSISVFNLNSNGSSDIFIQKLDVNGDFIWAKSVGGNDYDYSYSLAIDGNYNILSSGGFKDTVDFDPGVGTTNLISNGSTDVYVLKLDSNGNYLWAKTIGSSQGDENLSISTDVSGNIYTTGTFNDTVDFDPGVGIANLYSNGAADIFIQKLDGNGAFVWAKSVGGTLSDVSRSLSLDNVGGLYITGEFRDTVDFDPNVGVATLISSGSKDVYVLKLDKNGVFEWVKAINSSGSCNGESVQVNQKGNVYVVGRFANTISLDSLNTPLIANGGYDGFIIKLSQPSTVGVIENTFKSNYSLYPNPTNGQFNIDLGTVFKQSNIQIIDISGRIVYQSATENKQIVNLNFEAPKGIYFVRINTAENQSTIKLIKQ